MDEIRKSGCIIQFCNTQTKGEWQLFSLHKSPHSSEYLCENQVLPSLLGLNQLQYTDQPIVH